MSHARFGALCLPEILRSSAFERVDRDFRRGHSVWPTQPLAGICNGHLQCQRKCHSPGRSGHSDPAGSKGHQTGRLGQSGIDGALSHQVSVGYESHGSLLGAARMNRSSEGRGGVQRDFDAREDRDSARARRPTQWMGLLAWVRPKCLDRVPSGSQMWWTDTTSHTTGAGVPIWPSSLRCAAASGLCRMASNASWLSHCA
jgi:hypothetical protein